MKRKLLLGTTLLASTLVFSQNPDLSKWANKSVHPNSKQNVVTVQKSNLDLAGEHLKKSAQFQYGALGCAVASTAMFITSSLKEDKYETEVSKGTYTTKKKSNGTKDALVIGGCATLLTGVILELYSIEYKLKAGKCISLHASSSGGSLTLKF